MFDFNAWLDGLAVLAVFAAVGWLLSLPLRNVSIVDSMWSLMFLLAALTYTAGQASPGPRAWLVITLVGLWSIRLAAYISWRNRGHGEDFRYQKIRANNQPGFAFKSLYIVFGLQATLAWVVSLPLLAAINSTAPLGWLDAIGAALWLVGMVFEAGGDWQLVRFKGNPANQGKVLDTGLWRYTRHPNYFGECLIWWGLFLIAFSVPGGVWTVISPIIITLVLLKMTGVPLTERTTMERRPGYKDYMRRTNTFIPWYPKGEGR